MGSRRIFTPHFKLQVLESYRTDKDCKGNQRATARKYNIHRRQIQKWLQCETNLRSSVANISQNNVKHQFNNVNNNILCHQQRQNHNVTMPKYFTASENNQKSFQQQQFNEILSLSTTRNDVLATASKLSENMVSETFLSSSPAPQQTSTVLKEIDALQPHKSMLVCKPINDNAHPCVFSPSLQYYENQHYHHSRNNRPIIGATSILTPPISDHYHDQHDLSNSIRVGATVKNYYNINNFNAPLLQPQIFQQPSGNIPMLPTTSFVVSWNRLSTGTIPTILTSEKTNKNFHTEINFECDRSNTENVNCVDTYGKGFNENLTNSKDIKIPLSSTKPIDLSLSHQKQRSFNTFSPPEIPISTSSKNLFEDEINLYHVGSATLDLSSKTHTTHIHFTKDVSIHKFTEFTSKKTCSDSASTIKTIQDTSDDNEIFKINPATPELHKPIKLFKPYLLDERDKNGEENSYTKKRNKKRHCTILSYESTFKNTCQLQTLDNSKCPNSQSTKTSKPYATILRCSKGSPVSGYESSSSTFSDLSLNDDDCNESKYSVDLKVHPIDVNNKYCENIMPFQKWKCGDSIAPAARSSVFMFN